MPKEHRVKPGECIDSIAFEAGLFPDTVWDYADNADLKRLRKDPDVLQPGDKVTIPDKESKSIAATSGDRHRFRRKGIPKEFLMQLLDIAHAPIANAKARIDIDGRLVECTSDADGWIKCRISPAAKEAVILLEDGRQFKCKLGHLDPVDSDKGVQQRLRNLGFYHGPITAALGESACSALRAFQRTQGLEPSGVVDEATRSAMLKLSND